MIAARAFRARQLDTHPLLCPPVSRLAAGRQREGEEETAFAGRYRLRHLRGEGGMALVYTAVDLRSGALVAVKMLRHELIRNQEARLRFHCEARMTARVAHPNVVALLDAGHAAGDRPYLVMEHLEGRTLGELIAEQGPLPAERALGIAVQACRGLEAAHCAEIIHRDVKPDNLFICRDGQGSELVKVLDFGIGKVCAAGDPLARAIEALDSGRVVGTPHYMAPEQVCHPASVNEQTDVFSLGLVLREAMTGVRPHEGKSGGAIIDELLTHFLSAAPVQRPARARGTEHLGELEDVVAAAHAPDRRDRYPSARAFGAALSAALRGLAASSARAA